MISQLACDGTITLNPLSCDGSWVSVTTSAFDVSSINPLVLVEAMTAGFLFGGVPLAFVWVCRLVLKPLFAKW